MSRTAGRRAAAVVALVVAGAALAACGSDSPGASGSTGSSASTGSGGSGGFAGTMIGTSDVEGTGDHRLDGGALAAIPIAAMDGPFWKLVGLPRVTDPRGWSYLSAPLTEAQVADLGGQVAPIDDEGEFRLPLDPGEYAVCYWRGDPGGSITGCDAVELQDEDEVEASFGEAGFRVSVPS